MTENDPAEAPRARPAIWPYVVAAIVGSLAGAFLDRLLYADGGSMMMKIGLVLAPILYHLARKRRSA
ncbi:MAG: hypothetical protein AAF390_02040 [Pseudomonadota bacterium]